MKKILFVCSGNTCRSPMAVSIFKNVLKINNLQDKFIVHSAGINASNNLPMNENAFKTLKFYKIPVLKHSSMLLDEKEILSADYVITMTTEQKEFLSNYSNVYSMKELCGGEDINDPFGEDLNFYKKVCENLINSLNKLYKKLV